MSKRITSRKVVSLLQRAFWTHARHSKACQWVLCGQDCDCGYERALSAVNSIPAQFRHIPVDNLVRKT